ncbi:hypothetical protein SLOPH_1714 [Spraguea lophii 42_110]|uniref:Bromodomain associated domain-containing protein n=1 Tax=Spraguea lophii (strain 42_110) TaxID=1358809 RepID=S7XQD0_SPRLO|nr:hypothetical protein SLOPH_1714 [Spraguea lophii 42_110]
MKSKYIHKIISLCVTEILIQKGYEAVTNNSISTLTDILAFYLEKITQKIAENNGDKDFLIKMLIETSIGKDNYRTNELLYFLKYHIGLTDTLKTKTGIDGELEQILKLKPKNILKKQNMTDVFLKDYNRDNIKGLEVDEFMRNFIKEMDGMEVKSENKEIFKDFNLEDNPIKLNETKNVAIGKNDFLKILEEKKDELLQSNRYRTPYSGSLSDEFYILRKRMPHKN